MRTHLNDDMDAFGVWSDDYHSFLDMRGGRVLDELRLRLAPECLAASDSQ